MGRSNLVGLAALGAMVTAVSAKPFDGCQGGTLEGCPGTQNCSVHWINQDIDHFNWAIPPHSGRNGQYKQRYFIYDKVWSNDNGTRGPVFFYFGNEDNVELYVNHTGLMWEAAEDFGALLVFAEHRYYGQSLPFQDGTNGCMSWLTTEQAMADFAYLIDNIRSTMGADKSPFIGFGGSYGGMIAAWFRVHYPHAIDGVIAASAPIWSFSGLNPPYDFNSFDIGVTFDASHAGGSIDRCWQGLKGAWPKILAAAADKTKAANMQADFQTCEPVGPDDGMSIVDWASGPWGTMAMGNYPYASSYLMHGLSELPPWPVRQACSLMFGPFNSDDELFTAVKQAVSVYYNNTGTVTCYNITGSGRQQRRAGPEHRQTMRSPIGGPLPTERDPASCQGSWGYQWCTEMVQPFTSGTPQDMFYCPDGQNCSVWDLKGASAGCQAQWGVTPRAEWARVMLGGKRIQDATNIVFSNGLQDPWHLGGVLYNVSETVESIIIESGAHHIDLMFSDPADKGYPEIEEAREFERSRMRKWVAEAQERYAEMD